MKKLLSSTLTALALTASAHAQTATAVGTFDPVSATSNDISVYAGSLSASDLSAWKTKVSAAFTAGTGGVFNSFDSISGGTSNPYYNATTNPNGNFVPLTDVAANGVSFGTNKGFTISSSVAWQADAFTSANTLSSGVSSRIVSPVSNTGTSAYTLTFGLTGAGVGANERVTSVGLGLLGRSGAVGTVTLTATFSDNTTQALTTGGTLAQGVNAFFKWDAPTGAYITQLTYSSTAARINPFDDISWTTSVVSPIPEPSTYAGLAGLCALGLAAARRRKRA